MDHPHIALGWQLMDADRLPIHHHVNRAIGGQINPTDANLLGKRIPTARVGNV
jgi:hypothetical protein